MVQVCLRDACVGPSLPRIATLCGRLELPRRMQDGRCHPAWSGTSDPRRAQTLPALRRLDTFLRMAVSLAVRPDLLCMISRTLVRCLRVREAAKPHVSPFSGGRPAKKNNSCCLGVAWLCSTSPAAALMRKHAFDHRGYTSVWPPSFRWPRGSHREHSRWPRASQRPSHSTSWTLSSDPYTQTKQTLPKAANEVDPGPSVLQPTPCTRCTRFARCLALSWAMNDNPKP